MQPVPVDFNDVFVAHFDGREERGYTQGLQIIIKRDVWNVLLQSLVVSIGGKRPP